ncbi:hypothetical protein BB561_004322 [Smittium simulii]|uniref:Uncharacterized protein n=1 Tax=Smittium simulii TaxID=133385 RepID=A0A2T9YGY5_9FUNG|nr:hypothetical protein BB561_004322 [Smittium simulii]
MPKVPGVISSAAAGYSTVAKIGLIDPVSKNDYHFNFPPKNIQKTQVSYTNAAKNQKNLKTQKTQKKSSDRRIGCSWRQFSDNINEAFDYVTDATDDSCVTIEHDNIRKITYFQFDELSKANCFFKIPVHYCGRQVDLYQTVNIDKDIRVIKINNFQKVGVKTMVNALKETLNPIGEISDISAWAVKNKNRFMPYDMKVEIPNLIEVGGEFIPITYRGCQPICSFCKKSGHWKQLKKPAKNNDWSKGIPENPNVNFSLENKQNTNSLDKAEKKVFESLTSNENNIMLNIHIEKHLITQDEAQIAIELESPGNNNGIFTDSDLSSNLSYPSSPVAIGMIEPEPNKDNSVGRINIGLIEQLCEQQKKY